MTALSNDLPLTGYTEQLTASPGDRVEFKLSANTGEDIGLSIVRIGCADVNPAGPGLVEQRIAELGTISIPPQPFYPGSYGKSDISRLGTQSSGLRIEIRIWPTIIRQSAQMIVCITNSAGDDIRLQQAGTDLVAIAGGAEVTALDAVRRKHWIDISLILNVEKQQMGLSVGSQRSRVDVSAPASLKSITPKTIYFARGANRNNPKYFNGKIEMPRVFPFDGRMKDSLIAGWDFSLEMSSTRIIDVGPSACHGKLHNYPARAMTGSNWDGTEMCWRHASGQYGAIHFHEDDIYDFGWQTTNSWQVPDDLASGAYALRLDSAGLTDWVPFFVCPRPGQSRNRLAVLVSTITYAIYGNHARPDFDNSWPDLIAERGGYPWNPAEHRHYGLSTYNNHTDGSGICHASHKRPLLTLRPGYITFPNLECSGLRHYQADSHLLQWLEHQGIGYDLITDQQLHDHGLSILADYQAVTTGSHPEYHTPAMLDALSAYRGQGGNLVYLGGNGFYWRVALHPEDTSIIEIRRGEGGIRAWAAEPGEYYQAFDGGYGGLWRRNGRPPQQLCGVGFSAQGTFYGSRYRRTDESYCDPQLAFIFDGIEDDLLGDFGLCGGGAAGFELDRYDPELGSDDNIKVIASSEGHGDEFTLVPEERLTHITNWPGVPERELIRADMIYQELPNGGQLFSTGSITFCGSLLHNNSDNNISKLLGNVLKKFTT